MKHYNGIILLLLCSTFLCVAQGQIVPKVLTGIIQNPATQGLEASLQQVHNALTNAIRNLKAADPDKLANIINALDLHEIFNTSATVRKVPNPTPVFVFLAKALSVIPVVKGVVNNTPLLSTVRSLLIVVFSILRLIVGIIVDLIASLDFLAVCPALIFNDSNALVVRTLDFSHCLLMDKSFTYFITGRIWRNLPPPVSSIQQFKFKLVDNLFDKFRYPKGFPSLVVNTFLNVKVGILDVLLKIVSMFYNLLKRVPVISQVLQIVVALLSNIILVLRHQLTRKILAGLIFFPITFFLK